MTDENPDKGPLLELRGALDALDHKLLELLVKRMDIVAEIAARKRTHRVRIRDLARERRVLDDRCARAEELGLSPDSIESVWRQLMLMSRERQAALRAEVPPDVEPRTVAIIGGEGGMGRSLDTLFTDLGHEVLSADLDTELRPEDAAATADVVIISVPIRDTRAVIEELGPLVRQDALLMDVTSIKTDPMNAMLASTEASVLGTRGILEPRRRPKLAETEGVVAKGHLRFRQALQGWDTGRDRSERFAVAPVVAIGHMGCDQRRDRGFKLPSKAPQQAPARPL